MLKGIPSILSPDLVKILMEMGHGDEIVLADGNYPAASHAKHLVNASGHGVEELLKAILQLFPLDTYATHPVTLMQPVKGDPEYPEIWENIESIINSSSETKVSIEQIDRFEFYNRSKEAYAIIATGEKAAYANVILKKGVL